MATEAPRHDPAPAAGASADLGGLLRIADPAAYDVRTLWTGPRRFGFLTAPFGFDPHGRPVVLDIADAADGGMGPHGLCAGASGSGKSELLRTLVLTLAMTHAPDRLTFFLVDNTGSGTFGALDRLPHLAGRVERLSENPDQIDRLCAVLRAEAGRRDRALREAGDLADITEYDRRSAAGQPLAALPRLLVAIDEFDELAVAWPALLDLCTDIGRAGGRLGIHLLLAAHRANEGQLRHLGPTLRYRLGLRTFDPYESQALLGVPDAAALPDLPGSGLLRSGAGRLDRFRAVPVSGPYRPSAAEPARDSDPTRHSDAARDSDPARESDPAPTTLDVVVRRLRQHAGPAPQLWLPPLPAALPLDAVTGPAMALAGRGLVVVPPSGHAGPLRIPVGIVDRPTLPRQDPFVLDLSGGPASTGHLCVLGAREAGKSTLLCTLVAATALTHAPRDVRFACVDGSDGALAPLAGLPHVAGVAGRHQQDRVREVAGWVGATLADREKLFADRGIDSVAALRRLRREGALADLPATDVVLVIDDFAAFAADFPDLLDIVYRIGARGREHGVHLVLAAGRPGELPEGLRAVAGGPIELTLHDPGDSTVDARASALLPMDTPGRCLIAGPLYAQIALPRVDGGAGARDARRGLDELVSAMAGRA
ncbi:FtsK/SpoIIIE domain-containing protein [Rugosimonospora africana]|uniref:FtsK domain-containing protein n=1 Tax=Rugosimonospora africana TaxID=556532 RepID=A0A8J3VVX3_9ACTN|nr:FtsK/SpoIIIE domain-containing protein [Rugosimonospora africana]GIH20143.1 hypothetical protein Raf01_83150 [Rugosimonospora africana]